MIVTKTNKITGEVVTNSVDITGELLHEITIDIIDDTTKVLESGRLNHLNRRDIIFLYTGAYAPLTGTLEEKLEQYNDRPTYGATSII